MSGLFGWTGAVGDSPASVFARMASVFASDADQRWDCVRPSFALCVSGKSASAALIDADGYQLALMGHPHFGPAATHMAPMTAGQAFIEAYRRRGAEALAQLHGDYSFALHDSFSGMILLAVDRLGIHRLCYQPTASGWVFGSSLDALACHPTASRRISQQSIYDFLFFHVVPGPRTIYEDALRVLPGSTVCLTGHRATVRPYWQMQFLEDEVEELPARRSRFFLTLEAAVRRAASGAECGAFLSGGTDSSTIAGMLKRVTGRARTYSIGFDVPGYDEMKYARIASSHFRTEHREHYVTSKDVLQAAPRIATAYDQPFGNSSALPTLLCAQVAHEDGVQRLLGGDGGDELFGGNSRYAKQQLLALYQRLPSRLRSGALEPLLLGSTLGSRLPLLRKMRSYVEQARLPMPRRYESYNLLEYLGPQRVLTREFLAVVDLNAPHALMQEVHRPYAHASLINQMLGIDLRFTLADSDLPKVTRMCALAGTDVMFPLLDDEVVAFSATLPANLKLRGAHLRYFFKRALVGFLPPETIRKKKHGFGLPIGEWLARDSALREMTLDNLIWLRARRIVQPQFIDVLGTRLLHEHPSYYGTMVWLLLVLSLWMQSRTE